MSDYESAETLSPEELAKKLFSSPPADPCALNIIPYSENYDDDAVSFNFELLITIYLEGFMNMLDALKNNGKSESEIYNAMNAEDFNFPHPWFKSFSYSINVVVYGSEEFDKKEFNKIKSKSYCKIILALNENDKLMFIMKNISNRYHFILNSGFKKTNKLEDIYAVLSKGDNFFKISFKKLTIGA